MRAKPTHPPRANFLRRLALATVLAAPLACNPAWADRPSTRPAARPVTRPTAQPNYRVDVRRDIAYLASEELAGRYVGTAGIDKAAHHIADTFAKLGLQPAVSGGDYFQSFKMLTSTTVDPKTTLTAAGEQAKRDQDYQPLSFSSEGTFDGPLAFVGYGIASKEQKYDDYAGVDVKGKVVLAFRFEPQDEKGKSRFQPATAEKGDWSDEAGIPSKAKAAAERGAVAMLLVNPPVNEEGDDISPFARRFQFARASIPVIQIKRPLAERLLKVGKLPDLRTLQAEIDREGKPRPVDAAGVTVSGNVAFQRTEKDVQNVVAVLPGVNASEYVVIGGHYDHLGKGGPGSLAPLSKEIHPGADDNASGTAAMLSMADHFARLAREGKPPGRSLVFVAFTGEEEGLVGSRHYAEHPPVPLEKTVAMLNMDMVGRVTDQKLSLGGTGTAASFGRIVNEAGEGLPLKISTGSKGGMGPSDHTSFATKRIPVLFFFSGVHRDYHRPTDTADKINYEGLDDVVTLGQRIATAIAAMPREQYVAAHDSSGLSAMGSGGGGFKATLGVVPEYAEAENAPKGVRITGTGPGSAAEKAGLKGGDLIVGFGGKPVDNLQELSVALAKAKPGDKVKVVVKRDDLIVSFGGRPITSVGEFFAALNNRRPGDNLKVLVNRDGERVETEAVLTERKG